MILSDVFDNHMASYVIDGSGYRRKDKLKKSNKYQRERDNNMTYLILCLRGNDVTFTTFLFASPFFNQRDSCNIIPDRDDRYAEWNNENYFSRFV